MELYQRRQSTRNLGQNCRKDVVGIRRKRMSNFPCHDSIVQRSTQKQRTWKTVDSLCCRSGNNLDYSSHNCFCKSAQSLRSSRGNVKNMNPFTIGQGDLGQSIVLSAIKTEVSLENDDPAYQNFVLQQYEE